MSMMVTMRRMMMMVLIHFHTLITPLTLGVAPLSFTGSTDGIGRESSASSGSSASREKFLCYLRSSEYYYYCLIKGACELSSVVVAVWW